MKDNQIIEYGRIDIAVDKLANGRYTIPAKPDRIRYDHRILSEYARQNNKKTSELTEQELEMFILP